MITKTDCMTMLVSLEDKGINIDSQMKKLIVSKEIPLEVLEFIAKNEGIEVVNFYEMIRKKHNESKSKLYTNIVKEISTPKEVITTLSALLTQIFLYNNKLEVNNDIFLKEVRAGEITKVLGDYCLEDNIEACSALLKLIRTDLLVLEYINGRRELNS